MADSTREIVQIAAVLVVGGSQGLIESAERAVRGLQGTVVVTSTVREASTRAAEIRPFAIVMTEDLYIFDAAEFKALARDVHAQLIIVAPGDLTTTDQLRKAISRAFAERRRRQP